MAKRKYDRSDPQWKAMLNSMAADGLDLGDMAHLDMPTLINVLRDMDVVLTQSPDGTFRVLKGENQLLWLAPGFELDSACLRLGSDQQIMTLLSALDLIEAGKLDAGMIASVGDRLAVLACDPGMAITIPKYANLDGMPVRYDNGEAWVYADNSWQRTDFAEVHTQARMLNAYGFAKRFGQLPALLSAAFQSAPAEA
jgi:hypothetical protein